MYASEELGELAGALALAQAEMPAVDKKKTAKLGSYSYKYADLADVVNIASKVLGKHGLSISQHPESDVDGKPVLTTVLLHKSGQFLKSSIPLLITKMDAQSQGSAITYARRYAYGALTGVVTDDDDDGKAATESETKQRQQAPARAGGGSRNEAPAKPPEPASPGGSNKEMARSLLKTAVDQKWITSERANKVWWPHYDNVPHEQWVDELEREIATAQEGELWSEQNTEPATITNLQERVASVQAAQRTRPAPGSNDG